MTSYTRWIALFVFVPLGDLVGSEISENLWFNPGPVNQVKVGRAESAAWIYRASEESTLESQRLLVTHGRRDVLPRDPKQFESWTVFAPAAERDLIESPMKFWEAFRVDRFHDYGQQSTKVLAEPLSVDQWLKGGDQVRVGELTLEVFDTPGYTRGAITYVGDIDGRRTAFTGDLIYEGGRLIDLYSFQDAIPEAQIRGYHGYAARLAQLVSSLERLLQEELELIVPARGPLIEKPDQAMTRLIQRAKALYRNYLSTNALNWYFKEDRMRLSGERVLGKGADIALMPYSTHLETPDWILSHSTSRLMVSDEGYGFLLDCGYQHVIDTVQDWIEQGLVREIEGIFVTHFHDDHADQVQKAVELFDCPVYALSEYKDVLENPSAYHLPAMTANPISSVTEMKDGQRLKWREFDLTFHYYPGQAYHHGALMAEKEGASPIFFIGDSFSPSGMDDYCLLNRNLMHRDLGYFLCLSKLRQIPGEYWLINEHIPHIFRFSDVELGYLEQRYQERHDILSELVPWDDPNYAIDEQWAVFYPYGTEVERGAGKKLEVRITNHSPVARSFEILPHGNQGIEVSPKRAVLKLPARGSGSIEFQMQAPDRAGTYLLTADVLSEGMSFSNWIEALIQVE